MKAWLLPGYSDVQSMTLAEADEPKPGSGEVVLAVQFAALNPADRYLSIGQYPAKPAFPHVLGRDGIGTVRAVGEGVTGIKVGDTRLILRSEVGVSRPGTLAEKVVVEAAYTVEPPAGWAPEESAAAPLVYVTAWQALTQWGELPKDAHVLVTGASGGVGVATVQLAHALGYAVTALSRSEEKSARLRELGADHTFDPNDKGWRDAVKRIRRVDLVVDNIGGEAFNALLDVMNMFGRISVVGRLAGPVPSFNTSALLFRRLKVGGVAIATYTVEESHAVWKSVLRTLAVTGAKPLVDTVFPFEGVVAAFERLAAGPMGKVIVAVGSGN
jgi:NADPH2:quinone reductase